MHFRSVFFITLLILFPVILIAQDRIRFISAETGIDFIGCRGLMDAHLRVDTDDGTFFNNKNQQRMSKVYGGVKFEVRSKNDMIGFLTGIRFTALSGGIMKSRPSDYFFLLLRQTGTTTEYLKVNGLSQVSNYLGIPLEFRVFALKQSRLRLYFMAGTEISYRIKTENKARFENPAMEKYSSEVSEIIGTPNAWHASFYGRAGVVIGKEKPIFALGITFPAFINKSSSSMTLPTIGGGINLQIQKQF